MIKFSLKDSLLFSITVIIILFIILGGSFLASYFFPNININVATLLSLVGSLTAALFSFLSKQEATRNIQEVEKLRQHLTNQFPALKSTREAAINYYRSIASIQTGKFKPDLIDKAEDYMVEVEADLYFLPEEYRQKWYDYWQEVAVVSSLMRDKIDNLGEAKEAWKHQWKRELSPYLEAVMQWDLNEANQKHSRKLTRADSV
jgi:hypothetical protein